MKRKENTIELKRLLELFTAGEISLQELYDNSLTTELAKEWDMSVPTLQKRLKERGIKTKGRPVKKELPI